MVRVLRLRSILLLFATHAHAVAHDEHKAWIYDFSTQYQMVLVHRS